MSPKVWSCGHEHDKNSPKMPKNTVASMYEYVEFEFIYPLIDDVDDEK